MAERSSKEFLYFSQALNIVRGTTAVIFMNFILHFSDYIITDSSKVPLHIQFERPIAYLARYDRYYEYGHRLREGADAIVET